MKKDKHIFHPKKKSLLLVIVVLALFVFFSKPFSTLFSPASKLSYLQDVQPVLASKCYACHGPDEAKREAGLRLDLRESFFEKLESGHTAVDQNNFSKSEIIKRISSDDPDFRMPPPDFPKKLEPHEIKTIQKWVKGGLSWENHWAFEPIRTQAPPRVRNKDWSQNPIDAFILAAQKRQGLKHAPRADKRTLIRRLTYDLHGLPPTPEEVKNFLQDDAPDAYEKVVDRLLASPRYGERWARHWLDVVHYGETHGYDKDKRRPNAWPYRDYVIDAFNQDLPYDRFVEDQIAGDVLYPNDPQSTVALGFLAAGPWDFVGHVEVKNGTVDKRIVRNLDRDDMLTSAMSTFASLTAQCARCHDHKFDPILQTDYYSLQAVFAGIDRADRPYDQNPKIHRQRIRLKRNKKEQEGRMDALAKQLGAAEIQQIEQVQERQQALEGKIRRLKTPQSQSFGYHSAIEQQADLTKWIQIDLGLVAVLEKIVLTPAHPTEGIPMPGYGFPLRFKLEVSNSADFVNAETLIDFSRENHQERTDVPYVISVSNVKARYLRMTAYRLWKGRDQDHLFALAEIQAFSEGQNIARNSTLKVSDSFQDKRWEPRFLIDGFNSRRLINGETPPPASQKALTQAKAELAALKSKENNIRQSVLNEGEKEELDRIRTFLEAIEDSLNVLPEPSKVYAAAVEFSSVYQFQPPGGIRPIYLLNRGDTEQPQEEVAPGAVNILPNLTGSFELKEGHKEGARRAALARWTTDKNNAFTWRSIVNRVWQYHFGRGIVATPNDFGKMGAPPTHPKLLDYLAHAFLENEQSLKWLHRLILTSATYRQNSDYHGKNAQIDGGNRYLWRANRRQLEAEAIRDGVLFVSGKLDLSMGGPGFDAFRYEDDHSPRYLYKDYDPYDPSSFRRAIYRFIVRSAPDPLMTTLDCADPSQSVPVRNETVTALQALSALNNPFMVRQAAFFAERLEAEGGNLQEQLCRAFELAIQRRPKTEELAELENYASRHGLDAACRLIFAMNEFLYID